jgi:hypothetical protein
MATTKSNSTSKFQTEVQDMINGLTNAAPSTLRSMSVGGNPLTLAQVLAQFQAILQVLTTVSQTKLAYTAAVAARKAGMVTDRAFYANVVANLKQVFGASNQAQLAAFGIQPAKPRTKPSTTTRAIATAKAKATRTARGTMGKKQKLAITTTAQPTLQVLGPDGQPLQTPAAPASSSTSPTPTPSGSTAPAPAVTPAPAHQP